MLLHWTTFQRTKLFESFVLPSDRVFEALQPPRNVFCRCVKCDHDRVISPLYFFYAVFFIFVPIPSIIGRLPDESDRKWRYLGGNRVFDFWVPSTRIWPPKLIHDNRNSEFLDQKLCGFSKLSWNEVFLCENKPHKRKVQVAAVILVPIPSSNSQ